MFRLTATRVLRASAATASRRALFSTAIRSPVVLRSVRPTSIASTVAARQGVWASRSYSAAALGKEEVEGRIVALLQKYDKVNDPTNITATAHFANDLGLDSLDTVEVVMAIEDEFSIEIPDQDADSIHSVDKAVEYILKQPGAN